jgi:hypothetical protein
MSTVTAISFKPKATRKRLKKEILSDDFKKRKIFRTGKFAMEIFHLISLEGNRWELFGSRFSYRLSSCMVVANITVAANGSTV